MAAWSGCHDGQADDGIIAQGSDGFQAHVAGALDGPFIVLFEQDGADQADDHVKVGEDADDIRRRRDLVQVAFVAVADSNEKCPCKYTQHTVPYCTRSAHGGF